MSKFPTVFEKYPLQQLIGMNKNSLLRLAFRASPAQATQFYHGSVGSLLTRASLAGGESIRSLATKARSTPALTSSGAMSLKRTAPALQRIEPKYSMLFTTNTHSSSAQAQDEKEKSDRRWKWIDEEARELIAKAYSRHKALADKSQAFPPSLSVKDLERIGKPYHYAPQDFIDKCALGLMKALRVFVHGFFREKYDHHAVCLETVAAVPGLVGGFHRHLRSLRRMKRDHGWINVLQEEAENERMHLLIFMQVCKPTRLERGLVLAAQGMYLMFYSGLYLVNSGAAHRLTGYLEEEAHRAYTDYIACIDSGKLANKAAPEIAKNYYHLANEARMRDVLLHVRADEAMHRDMNHHLGNKYKDGDMDSSAVEPYQ